MLEIDKNGARRGDGCVYVCVFGSAANLFKIDKCGGGGGEAYGLSFGGRFRGNGVAGVWGGTTHYYI